MLWLWLDKPSYFSRNQGSGVLFSRGTAMAYPLARTSLFPLKEYDFADCLEPGQSQAFDPRPIDLEHACGEREAGKLSTTSCWAGGSMACPRANGHAPVPLAVEWPNDPAGQRDATRHFFILFCRRNPRVRRVNARCSIVAVADTPGYAFPTQP